MISNRNHSVKTRTFRITFRTFRSTIALSPHAAEQTMTAMLIWSREAFCYPFKESLTTVNLSPAARAEDGKLNKFRAQLHLI